MTTGGAALTPGGVASSNSAEFDQSASHMRQEALIAGLKCRNR